MINRLAALRSLLQSLHVQNRSLMPSLPQRRMLPTLLRPEEIAQKVMTKEVREMQENAIPTGIAATVRREDACEAVAVAAVTAEGGTTEEAAAVIGTNRAAAGLHLATAVAAGVKAQDSLDPPHP